MTEGEELSKKQAALESTMRKQRAQIRDLEEDKEKGVPAFWLTAMKSNEVLAEEISERDEGALKFLKDIKWSRIENPKGFKLDFFFDCNPYFTNTVLTKTYHMIDEDEPILEKAIEQWNKINLAYGARMGIFQSYELPPLKPQHLQSFNITQYIICLWSYKKNNGVPDKWASFSAAKAIGKGHKVPKGYLEVYVGDKTRRFVIPLLYLNQPSFQELLSQAEEEFGYDHPTCGLTIQCNEDEFLNLTSHLNELTIQEITDMIFKKTSSQQGI
ncbi:Nucleosome assembly protein 1;3, partial [Mucuna pruriens]